MKVGLLVFCMIRGFFLAFFSNEEDNQISPKMSESYYYMWKQKHSFQYLIRVH